MYNLSLHIEYLLLHHDCVVVPGLGAFINVRHAAYFDAVTRVWHPMTREVRFNGALTHDDGLLSSSYARKEGSSFQEGRETLRRDTQLLIAALESDGEVTLGQLGILRRTENTLMFIPRQSAAQWASLLGYSQIPAAIPPAHAIESETNADTAADTDGVTTEQSENAKHTAGGRIFDTERNYYIAINKLFARTAACLIIVAIMTISFVLPLSDRNREDQASVIPVEKIIHDTASRIASAMKERNASPETDTVSLPEKEIRLPLHRFHAIVATFTSKEEAETFIEQNADCGYDLEVVSTHTKSRVSAMSSDNSGELRSAMADPGFKTSFSQAWIWEDTTQSIAY